MNSLTTRGFAACAILAATSFATAGTLEGDVNEDHAVNINDLLLVLGNMNQYCPPSPESCPTDLNGDDMTNDADVSIVMANYGATEESSENSESESDSSSTMSSEQEPILVDPEPVVMDAIYYDMYSRTQSRANLGWDLDQGWQTRGWNSQNGVDVLPYAYGGGVDYDHDMQYTDEDLDNFQAWLDENIPYDYEGPVVLDMEGEWWQMMNYADQDQMDEIIDFYIQGLGVR